MHIHKYSLKTAVDAPLSLGQKLKAVVYVSAK